MQFTLAHPASPSVLSYVLSLLFLGSLVGPPLVLWLRRSPRDEHDVLASGPLPRRRILQGFRDLLGWACIAVAFIGPVLLTIDFVIQLDLVLFGAVSAVFDGGRDTELVQAHSPWSAFATMTVLGATLRVWWLRNASSGRDVLHIGTREA